MPRNYKPTGNPPGRPKGKKCDKPYKLSDETNEFGFTNGRKKGESASKCIQRLKDALANKLCCEEEIEALFQDLHDIKDPKDRCAMRRDLYQYVIPKVTAVDMNANLEVESVGDELSKLTHNTVMDGALGLGEENKESESGQPSFS